MSQTIKEILPPLLYLIVDWLYWDYATYQQITNVRFVLGLTICAGALAAVMIYTNKWNSKKAVTGVIILATLLTVIQVAAYSLLGAIPGGWGSLQY